MHVRAGDIFSSLILFALALTSTTSASTSCDVTKCGHYTLLAQNAAISAGISVTSNVLRSRATCAAACDVLGSCVAFGWRETTGECQTVENELQYDYSSAGLDLYTKYGKCSFIRKKWIGRARSAH